MGRVNEARLVVVDGRGLQTELSIHCLCIVGEHNHGGQTAIEEKLEGGQGQRGKRKLHKVSFSKVEENLPSRGLAVSAW